MEKQFARRRKQQLDHLQYPLSVMNGLKCHMQLSLLLCLSVLLQGTGTSGTFTAHCRWKHVTITNRSSCIRSGIECLCMPSPCPFLLEARHRVINPSEQDYMASSDSVKRANLLTFPHHENTTAGSTCLSPCKLRPLSCTLLLNYIELSFGNG